ncbi:hypothetical protein N658DRAFT_467377 [Parathielavia hyrcaniae]|uniref:F-box domain-containing protein n=1 Tax=Parathielavia hyrcaniae TaxID=113614 RepID=A0AAN6Q594_9PEZI|nr:hypothetical protein N658DRAFT_467377 [Parathielavia hyrcaniae]
MAGLTNLPPELLHTILSYVDIEDLARISVTCRCLSNFVKGNNALCRAVYLRHFDEPRVRDLNFEQELRDVLALKSLLSPKDSPTRARKTQRRIPFVYNTVTRLLNHAVAVPAPGTTTATTSNSDSDNSSTKHDDPSASSNPSTTRPSRAQTFPHSRNAAFLTALFAPDSARSDFLTHSWLFERGRHLKLIDYGGTSTSTSTSDSDSDSGEEGGEDEEEPRSTASSLRRRRRRRKVVDDEHDEHGLLLLRRPKRARAEDQMSAKLHCLYGWGLGLDDGLGDPGGAAAAADGEARKRAVWAARQGGGAYSLACSKVYDMREYTRGSRWGPFLEGDSGDGDGGGDGVRVDWEKVEAIMMVLGTNIRAKGLERFPIFLHFWGKPFAGTWAQSYIPWSRDRELGRKKEVRELDREDPYGATGCWLRVVSFLDYHDFYHFNFPSVDGLPPDVPRPPLDEGQATRLILMRMRVKNVEPPGPGDHPDYPVTHFGGFSRALDGSWDDNADAVIRGTVRVTPEGDVHWTSYSVYNGEERWKSEGVQVGGIRSARGVVGTWFDKDFNPEGPLGPTAFWKISDRESQLADGPQVLLEDLFPLIADDMDEELDDEGEESGDEFVLQGLDPFGPDWTEYELDDELDGLYYFDDEDVFEADDLEAHLGGPGEDDEEEEEGNDDDEGPGLQT